MQDALVPPLLRAVWAMVLIFWAGTNAAYFAGAGGFRFSHGTSSTSFGRENDAVLFRIDDRHAFQPNSGMASLVTYESDIIPLRPLCGTYCSEREILPVAGYRKGPWLYTEFPWPGHAHAYNLETRQQVTYEGPQLDRPLRPGEAPALERLGLVYAPELALSLPRIEAELPRLDVVKQSCVDPNMAFLLVTLLLAPVTAGLAWVRWRRRRAPAAG